MITDEITSQRDIQENINFQVVTQDMDFNNRGLKPE